MSTRLRIFYPKSELAEDLNNFAIDCNGDGGMSWMSLHRVSGPLGDETKEFVVYVGIDGNVFPFLAGKHSEPVPENKWRFRFVNPHELDHDVRKFLFNFLTRRARVRLTEVLQPQLATITPDKAD